MWGIDGQTMPQILCYKCRNKKEIHLHSLIFKVFFNPDSMSNIISLKDTVNIFCTTSKERTMFIQEMTALRNSGIEFMDFITSICKVITILQTTWFLTTLSYRLYLRTKNNLRIKKLKERTEPDIYRKP